MQSGLYLKTLIRVLISRWPCNILCCACVPSNRNSIRGAIGPSSDELDDRDRISSTTMSESIELQEHRSSHSLPSRGQTFPPPGLWGRQTKPLRKSSPRLVRSAIFKLVRRGKRERQWMSFICSIRTFVRVSSSILPPDWSSKSIKWGTELSSIKESATFRKAVARNARRILPVCWWVTPLDKTLSVWRCGNKKGRSHAKSPDGREVNVTVNSSSRGHADMILKNWDSVSILMCKRVMAVTLFPGVTLIGSSTFSSHRFSAPDKSSVPRSHGVSSRSESDIARRSKAGSESSKSKSTTTLGHDSSTFRHRCLWFLMHWIK